MRKSKRSNEIANSQRSPRALGPEVPESVVGGSASPRPRAVTRAPPSLSCWGQLGHNHPNIPAVNSPYTTPSSTVIQVRRQGVPNQIASEKIPPT